MGSSHQVLANLAHLRFCVISSNGQQGGDAEKGSGQEELYAVTVHEYYLKKATLGPNEDPWKENRQCACADAWRCDEFSRFDSLHDPGYSLCFNCVKANEASKDTVKTFKQQHGPPDVGEDHYLMLVDDGNTDWVCHCQKAAEGCKKERGTGSHVRWECSECDFKMCEACAKLSEDYGGVAAGGASAFEMYIEFLQFLRFKFSDD